MRKRFLHGDRQRVARRQHRGSTFGAKGGEPFDKPVALGSLRPIYLAAADFHRDDVDLCNFRRLSAQQEQPR